MVDVWHHILTTSDGRTYVHRLDPDKVTARAREHGVDEVEVHGEVAQAWRRYFGCPVPDGNWHDEPGWESRLTPGRPHEKLMDAIANPDDVDVWPDLPPVAGSS